MISRYCLLFALTACGTTNIEPLTVSSFYEAYFEASCATAIQCNPSILGLPEDATVASCLEQHNSALANEINKAEGCAFNPDKARGYIECVSSFTCDDLKRSDLDCEERTETVVCEKQDTGVK